MDIQSESVCICVWMCALGGILLILCLKVQLGIDVLLVAFNCLIEITSLLQQMKSGQGGENV